MFRISTRLTPLPAFQAQMGAEGAARVAITEVVNSNLAAVTASMFMFVVTDVAHSVSFLYAAVYS